MTSDSYLELVKNLSSQLAEAAKLEVSKVPVGSFNKILITGMGGSSIVGMILQSYLFDSKIPVFVSRSYSVPNFVDRNTLVFAISYSGNTEETISALRSAHSKSAVVVGVTSGGKLLTRFQEENAPLIRLPAGLQPRASLCYQFIPIIRLLGKMSLIPDPNRDIARAISAFKDISPYNDRAKTLAGKLTAKIPFIYASDRFASVAYRWKTQFNENAKIHAFDSVFPELNHNEIVGYTNLNGNYHVILLEDQDDPQRVKLRMKITKELITNRNVPVTQIVIKGDNLLIRLLSAIHIGDLASVYLAIFTNTDPEPVPVIEDLKRQLAKVPFV